LGVNFAEMEIIVTASFPLMLYALPMFAQEWVEQSREKSPRHREWATVNHDNRTVRAFIVFSEMKQKTALLSDFGPKMEAPAIFIVSMTR
jgi:hypothetical protein